MSDTLPGNPLQASILRWTYVGIDFGKTETEKRHIVFSNVVYLTLPLVYFIFILIDYKALLDTEQIWRFDRIIFYAIVTLCFFFLKLNQWGHVTASRVLFLISWIVLMHIAPIVVHNSPSDYYIAYPLGLIFHSFLIHLCFSAHQERKKFWPFLAANCALMLTAPHFLVAFDLTPEETNVLRTDPYYALDIILYWLLINLLSFYFLYVFEAYINKLRDANALIIEQQDEMVQKNADLQRALDEVTAVNGKMEHMNRNLEQIVKSRTRELQEKNDRLFHYAFVNAHMLRGPLCRIKGLHMLRPLIKDNEIEIKQVDRMMDKSIEDLDKITADIQSIVSVAEQQLDSDKTPTG